MTPAASASFVSAELSEFLYAPIGSENNGMTLSVLSALTRLNIDPWDEAAQLCELPKQAAAARLCSLITRLPAGSWTHADCQAIAEHLIEFLPHRSSLLQDARGSRRINLGAVRIIIAVALGLAALLIASSCEPSRANGSVEHPLNAHGAKEFSRHYDPFNGKHTTQYLWTEDPVMEPYKVAGRLGQAPGYAGPAGKKAAEVLTKYIVVDMYAKAIQGMPAEDAANSAEGELKAIY
jgi:hypothetical protein